MKLLIVLGLFPLFSAQQFGYGSLPRPQGQGLLNNNNWPAFNFNNNKNKNNFGGFSSSSSNYNKNNNNNNNNDGFSGDILGGINGKLIEQLRFMTDSLSAMLKQAAQDPRTNEAFKVMDKICVSNMDETIQMLKLGSNAAELSLLDVTDLLDDAVEGKVKSPEAARQEIEEKFNVLKQQAGATSSSSSRRNNYKKNYNYGK